MLRGVFTWKCGFGDCGGWRDFGGLRESWDEWEAENKESAEQRELKDLCALGGVERARHRRFSREKDCSSFANRIVA